MSQSFSSANVYFKFSSFIIIKYVIQEAWIHILASSVASFMTLYVLTFLSLSFHIIFMELIIVPSSWKCSREYMI